MKRLVVIILLFFCFTTSISCSTTTYYEEGKNPANQNAISISIVQLISNQIEYDGKIVRVIGVGNLAFEGNGVYLSRDDWKYGVTKNGLWISLGEQATPDEIARKFNGKYVIIEGTFDMGNTGHMGLYSGAIIEITRYELWEV